MGQRTKTSIESIPEKILLLTIKQPAGYHALAGLLTDDNKLLILNNSQVDQQDAPYYDVKDIYDACSKLEVGKSYFIKDGDNKLMAASNMNGEIIIYAQQKGKVPTSPFSTRPLSLLAPDPKTEQIYQAARKTIIGLYKKQGGEYDGKPQFIRIKRKAGLKLKDKGFSYL